MLSKSPQAPTGGPKGSWHMRMALNVLIVEDSEPDFELIVEALRGPSYDLHAERVDTRDALLEALNRRVWHVVIADFVMPQFSGTAALKIVHEQDPHLPFIFVSGTMGEDVAVEAMKNGAHDYVMKSNLARLAPAVERELRDAEIRREHERAEERLAHLAYHDALTDLPNRMLLQDRLQQSIAAARRTNHPMTLLVMDLDGFKDINDTLGHSAGDRVLQEVAERLRSRLREVDTVARLGGDEFAVILPETDLGGAEVAARKILESLRRPVVVDDRPLTIRASIGISRFPDHGSIAETLLQTADIAMYLAKNDGTGVAVYSADRNEFTPRRLALSADLGQAIERRQLTVEYQPILHLRTGSVIAVEALVRWNHHEFGRLLPNEFIHLAEQRGYIDEITSFVLERALSDWRSLPALPVAVNLSPRSLDNPQLPNRIVGILKAQRATPSTLALEITEEFITSGQPGGMTCLTQLHELGVNLSIDDFGTGFSSLRNLRGLPIDKLKIDTSFIGVLTRSDDVLVRSAVNLAHNLGMTAIAEGVESEDVYHQLLAMGCDAAQGNWISEPLPIEEVRPRVAIGWRPTA